MDFITWLRTRNITSNPRGDFLVDLRQDADFPRSGGHAVAEEHLKRKRACREVWHEFHMLFRQFIRENPGMKAKSGN